MRYSLLFLLIVIPCFAVGQDKTDCSESIFVLDERGETSMSFDLKTLEQQTAISDGISCKIEQDSAVCGWSGKIGYSLLCHTSGSNVEFVSHWCQDGRGPTCRHSHSSALFSVRLPNSRKLTIIRKIKPPVGRYAVLPPSLKSFVGSSLQGSSMTAPLLYIDDTSFETIAKSEFSDLTFAVLVGPREGSKLTARGLAALRLLKELRSVTFLEAGISDTELSAIASAPALEELIVNGKSSVTDKGILALCKLNLKRLDLPNSPLLGSGLKCLEKKPISFLNLSNTQVDDEALKHLSSLPLETLFLKKTKITAAGLKYLASIPSLRNLDITNNNISQSEIRLFADSLKQPVHIYGDKAQSREKERITNEASGGKVARKNEDL